MVEKYINMTPKARKTHRSILDAAYSLFTEVGYQKTTMRAIAKNAGIAAGGIYHYFPSKAHIVQAYYSESVQRDEKECRHGLDDHRTLTDRLNYVLRQKIENNIGAHGLAKSLFVVATDPNGALSPFSDASRETRHRSIGLFRDLVEGADDIITPELKELLPEYLWLLQMGVILFWIYDESPYSETTLALIDRLCVIFESLMSTMSNPFFFPFRKKIIESLTEFKPTFGESK